MTQGQFLDVIDLDEAHRRFRAALRLEPLDLESLPLEDALGRVLAENVVAAVDVPSFDRSNYDGYAVQAADTYGAEEEKPRQLRLLSGTVASGMVPEREVRPGEAVAIATGGMLPRGADAVVMVEHTDPQAAVGGRSDTPALLLVRRPVTPGHGISSAGSDLLAAETVFYRGVMLTSRDTGVLAAIGIDCLKVVRRPRVAILSTGNEIIEPGQTMRPGLVYDCNARILADAVRELGGEPLPLGIVPDDLAMLQARLREALSQADAVLLSGGTSKGTGDISYRAVGDCQPGVVVHGVAIKPGKPVCLAADRGRAVVVLPGFPASAITTFHEFVAPVIRCLAGTARVLPPQSHLTGAAPGELLQGGATSESRPTGTVRARLAVRINSVPGRAEFLLVQLVTGEHGLSAYPMAGGSGSITTFSRADGFARLERHEEVVEAGAILDVHLLSPRWEPPDLVVIGSHCLGLDYLLGRLHDAGYTSKFMAVGSTAGLDAARRSQCDLAGAHLLDDASGQYNRPFLSAELELLEGYGRWQGLVFRPGDPRFADREVTEAIALALADRGCRIINRSQGSGTRLLIDRLLGGRQPPGYAVQSRSHNAVAAAIAQGRADWGVAVESAARAQGLGFTPLELEHYDFFVPRSRLDRPAVTAFHRLLLDSRVRTELQRLGLALS